MPDSPYASDTLVHLATDDRKTLCGRFVAYQQEVATSTDTARLAALAARYERVTCGACAAALRCPDCGILQSLHLTADEADDHDIDTRDGRGCAVITRATR